MAAARSTLIFAGKAAVTLAAFALLLSRIDLARMLATLGEARGPWLAAALVWHGLALVISTIKWEGLLLSLGIVIRRRALLELYTIGFFASAFLPGMVGGDVVRWHLAGGHLQERARVAVSILAERLTGFVGLVILAVLALILDAGRLARGPVIVLVGAMLGALLAALGLLLSRGLALRLVRVTRRTRLRGPLRPIFKLHRILRSFPPRPLAIALGHTAIFYIICAVTYVLVCRSLGIRIDLLAALAVQTIVSLLTTVPISLGGLGLAQIGDVYVLGLLGVDPAVGFSVSIVRQVINLVYRLIGGILFLGWKGRQVR